ncbi:MAG: CcoQ/FixQ family Cbb3-type cytochrome c oxidase assembly chaperone [Gemmatimonadales bacterium]|nr:CcoQ/FixQ family Cbb3-type cytochrome c oxidase assembly chaperone [Gemmatimonadales bacterium]
MKLSDIMAAAGLAGWAQAALILFLVAFVAILIRVFAPSRRREFEAAGRMPLDDDHPVTPRARTGDQP